MLTAKMIDEVEIENKIKQLENDINHHENMDWAWAPSFVEKYELNKEVLGQLQLRLEVLKLLKELKLIK